MDIMRKLQSILAPSAGPVNRAQPAIPRPATPAASQTFAQALRDASLEDPSIAPFGVQERLPGPIEGHGTAAGAGGPTILPDIPQEPILDLPVDVLHIEMRDTLESMVVLDQEPDAPANPGTLPPPVAQNPRAVTIEPPTAPIPRLPPIGVLWAPVSLRGSGASGPGIAGTDSATQTDLQNKFEYYTNPEKYGLILNQEARLFLDAVDKGYVSNSPEGLGTLLAGLGRGAVGHNARPPEMTEYFHQFYVGEQTLNS